MADLVKLVGPVSVANLTAAAGVTTTVDGWWPCLDITFRTPVPPSITKIAAQVRERGTTSPVAETVLTKDEITAGAAKIVNGVSVGQHLEVRLSPAGAPGLPFQPTPWLEVTTSWDALMAALDGLLVGCVKIVCGVGEPTRDDLPVGSLYIEESQGQVWQYEAGAGEAEAPFGVNIVGTDLDAGTNTVTLSGYTAGHTLTFTKPPAASSGGELDNDAFSAHASGPDWRNDVWIYGDPSGASELLYSYPNTEYATAALAQAAMDADLPFVATGYEVYDVVGVDDTVLDDNRGGLSILVTVRPPAWVLKSDTTSFEVNGVEVANNPRTIDLVGAAVSGTVDDDRKLTIEIDALAGDLGATDNALVRADGTGGKTAQGGAITMSDAGALTFPDDVRQTFNPGGTNAGLNVGSLAGDPSSPTNGDVWYDSSANELTARINGSNVALGAGSTNALDDLSDVDTSGATDGDVLAYDAGSGTWVPQAPSGGGGGSDVEYDQGVTGVSLSSSGSAFATKGILVAPIVDVTLYSITARLTLVSGATYKARVYQVADASDTAAISSVVDAGAAYVAAAAATGVLVNFALAAASVTLTAGNIYVLAISRTDSTDTYALPLWSSTTAGRNWLKTPMYIYPTASRIAKANPAAADAQSNTTGQAEIGVLFDGTL